MGLLENRHLVRVGVISYGVYLLHWPIWLIVKKVIPYEPYSLRGIAIFILYLAVTIAVCEASYRLYEVKFLRLKDRFFAKLHPKATEVKQEERVPELIS
jgi:peptidoglycan/LPS O-acetylase OafA/YrhL